MKTVSNKVRVEAESIDVKNKVLVTVDAGSSVVLTSDHVVVEADCRMSLMVVSVRVTVEAGWVSITVEAGWVMVMVALSVSITVSTF